MSDEKGVSGPDAQGSSVKVAVRLRPFSKREMAMGLEGYMDSIIRMPTDKHVFIR